MCEYTYIFVCQHINRQRKANVPVFPSQHSAWDGAEQNKQQNRDLWQHPKAVKIQRHFQSITDLACLFCHQHRGEQDGHCSNLAHHADLPCNTCTVLSHMHRRTTTKIIDIENETGKCCKNTKAARKKHFLNNKEKSFQNQNNYKKFAVGAALGFGDLRFNSQLMPQQPRIKLAFC